MRPARKRRLKGIVPAVTAFLFFSHVEAPAQTPDDRLLPIWDNVSTDETNLDLKKISGTALYFNSSANRVKFCYANFTFYFRDVEFNGHCGELETYEVPSGGRAMFQPKSAAEPTENVAVPGVVWMLKTIDPLVSSIHACVMFGNRFICRRLEET
jgi:hypothetical protein